MKKGDKVRFIHSVGGGLIAGFKDKETVLVEDEDGFQIPTPINEVVVVESASDEIRTEAKPKMQASVAQTQSVVEQKSVSTPPPPQFASLGNKLTLHIAFIAMDMTRLGRTVYETYLVNDSNYTMHVVLSTAEGSEWHLRFAGEIRANSKTSLCRLDMSDMPAWERICVQMTAYKSSGTYELKPSVDVQMRLDQVKLCKAGSFKQTDYFEDPAMLVTVINADHAARPLVVRSDAMKREMYKDELPQFGAPIKHEEKKEDPNAPLVIDLHADALLDTLQGMSSAGILEYQMDQFRKIMNENRKKKGKKIIFIHGKGEGMLRRMLITELQRRYKPCTFQDASFREYGYGATQVNIK